MRARNKQENTKDQFLLTYPEAAQRFAVGINNVRRMALQAGAVVHLGKSARVVADKLENYLLDLTE